MQAEYPKKIPPTHWDAVHLQPRVRKFPETGESSEAIARKWRPPPEVIQPLKPPIPEVTYYDRDYTVTSQLTRSQTREDFTYKAPETHRFNKHTAWAENEYIYPPSRRLIDQPPACNAHGTTEMRSAYKEPSRPPSLVTNKDQYKHPACLPLDPPMVEPSWHKELEPLDTTHEGFEKYLDPYLTTSRLHHRPYTAEQLSRLSVTRDILTYHTFSKDPWVMADSTTSGLNVVNEAGTSQESLAPQIDNLFADWPATTVVTEPKVPYPDPILAQQGRELQKFGSRWKEVRYAEVRRQFESKAPFADLEVNQYLEPFVPRCKTFDYLQKFDQALGAITYGLLQQKKILQETIDSLPEEVREAASNAFNSADSKYKKISDSLLQYVTGRRSHVIQQRREIFKPRNMDVRQALYGIPPSENYLFAEPRITEMVDALANGMDQLAPNTDKCNCCRKHKERRRKIHSESQEEEEDEPISNKKRRRR